MDAIAALAKTPLFKEFTPADLKKLAAVAQEDHPGPGAAICREGDKGDRLFVIVMGSVRVLKKNRDGVEEEVATLGSGSCFGEMALVDETHERSATIVPDEASSLLVLARGDIEGLCQSDAKLAHRFYFAIARSLAKRLNATTTDAAFFKALAKQKHF